MNGYNIPVGISEDWDRTAASSNAVAMNATDGSGLADVGKKVKANTDVVHAHIMPYYHPDEVVYAAKSWGYVDHYLSWLNEYVGQPVMVTEVSLAAEVRSVEPEVAAEADLDGSARSPDDVEQRGLEQPPARRRLDRRGAGQPWLLQILLELVFR